MILLLATVPPSGYRIRGIIGAYVYCTYQNIWTYQQRYKTKNYNSYIGIVIGDKQKQLDVFELRNNHHLVLTQAFATMHGCIAISLRK